MLQSVGSKKVIPIQILLSDYDTLFDNRIEIDEKEKRIATTATAKQSLPQQKKKKKNNTKNLHVCVCAIESKK